jgi:predicted nucleic acid-binding protein
MSIGLDTSVVLRLLTGTPADQAEQARRLVASAHEPVVISDLVVSEVYFALRHHYGIPHRDTVRVLRAVLDDQQVRCSGLAHLVLAAEAAQPSPPKAGLMDRLILAEYARDGIQLATFDRALARRPGARSVASTPGV